MAYYHNFNCTAPNGSSLLLRTTLKAKENDDIAQLLPGKDIWLGVTGDFYWSGSHWNPSNFNDLMYTNWRSGDGLPSEVSGNGKSNAFMSQSDGTNEWITASENEQHYIVCIFRI